MYTTTQNVKVIRIIPLYCVCTVHHLRTIQAIVENVYVWLVGLRRPESER